MSDPVEVRRDPFRPMRWYEQSVDELFIGLGIGAVASIAIIWLGKEAVPIANTAVGVMGTYLAGRAKNNNGG